MPEEISKMIRFGCRLGLKLKDEPPVKFKFGGPDSPEESFSKWLPLRSRIIEHISMVHGIEAAPAAEGDGPHNQKQKPDDAQDEDI
eukprot:2121110-Pyramimonas_sp.AAC.1